MQKTPETDSSTIRVWTDGACKGNGKTSKLPRAGSGVYFGPGDPRNVSEPLPGDKQTNQRAEMHAAIRALEVLIEEPRTTPVEIITDSQYLIKGITTWIKGWKQRDWISSNFKPVANRDLWEKLDALSSGRPVSWTHVKGHSDDPGNEAADRLATQGADAPREDGPRKKRKVVVDDLVAE